MHCQLGRWVDYGDGRESSPKEELEEEKLSYSVLSCGAVFQRTAGHLLLRV